MKPLITAAFAIVGGAATAWAAASPQLLALLPADSKVIAGIDIGHAKTSPFGKFLLEQVDPASELETLKAATGFDPRTDIFEVVSGGVSRGELLTTGRGAFPIAKLTELAQLADTPLETHRGAILINLDNGSKALSRANTAGFLDGSTVVIGTRAQVIAAIDRSADGGIPGDLTKKAAEASTSSDAWAVTTDLSELPGAGDLLGPPKTETPEAEQSPQTAIARSIAAKIQTASASLTFGSSDVTARGQLRTTSAQDAQEIAGVFQLLLGMAGSQDSPLTSAQFTPEGQAVNFTLKLTEQQAEDLVKPKLPANRSEDKPFVLE